MKKFLITGLFIALSCTNILANEMTEDYFDIATNYCIEGNYRMASEYLDKILLAEPGNKTILDLRNGLRLIMQGNHTSYIKNKYVKEALGYKNVGDKIGEVNSLAIGNDYWSNYFIGEYYKQNKDYNQAIKNYIKSVNAKPTFTQCYLQIAICYYELGNYIQTITYLNQYLKSEPQDDFAYALSAKAHYKMGNTDKAYNEISTAIAFEDALEYEYMLAKILFKMEKYDQAVAKLENLKKDIQIAELYKYLGLAYAQLGNNSDAIINLGKAILLCDDDKELNMKYNELRNQ